MATPKHSNHFRLEHDARMRQRQRAPYAHSMMTRALNETWLQAGRRTRQIRHLIKTEGLGGVSEKVRRYVARRIAPETDAWPVFRADVLRADFTRLVERRSLSITAGEPISINWVMLPPGAGSGGHTTIFRILHHLEKNGYRNRIYFYDPYGGDYAYYERIVRDYFRFQGPIARVDDGLEDAHAVVATAWPSAYPVFNAGCAGKRYYFVQDFEPYFYPVSSFGALAENTYRMGFHAITAGRWLSEKLTSEFGMPADYFEFGCDKEIYNVQPGGKRNGIAFYYRPSASRRGTEIALLAIEKFAERRPDIDLHFYGTKCEKLPFRVIDHGLVTPQQLNQIYNQCYCGLSLSLTNVSLVPHEMLAAGCIPIVNDAAHNRLVLQNDFVRYVPLNPHAIASELEKLTTMPNFETLSQEGAASIGSLSWAAAGEKVDAILRKTLPTAGKV